MHVDTSIRNICIALIYVIIFLMYSSTSDATCSLPQDLINTALEYNYTKVEGNTEQSTILNIATTTLQNSAINLDAKGTKIDDWTCINSLDISDTESVVVFKSDNSFSDGPFGGSQWLYLCMKLTKVTTDLYYFYLLSDTFTGVTPNERVFVSEERNPPNDNDPVCSTFCRYTDPPNIRTLQKPGTHDALPNDASLCEPCSSSCIVASSDMTSTETTQKTTIPPTSTKIDTTIEMTSIETTPITSQPPTSTKIDTSTTKQSTETTQTTYQPTTSTKIDTFTTIRSTETTPMTSQPTTSTKVETITTKQSTETTQTTSQPTTSTEIDNFTTIQSAETTTLTSQPTTSTEVNTITTIQSTETTHITTMHSSSTKRDTTADITSTDTIKTTTKPTTSTELETTTVVESITTSPEINPLTTSTEIDRSTETTTKETTAVHSSAAALETTQLTTIHFTSKDTEITTELKDETTVDNLFTDTEQLKRYSGPIILAGLGICGFVLVIIVFVLLKVVKGRSMIDTERIENKKEQDAYNFTPEACYIYKGKDYGFQKIAIQHWDHH